MAGASLCQAKQAQPLLVLQGWQTPAFPHQGFLPTTAPHASKEEKAQGLLGRGRESQEGAQLGLPG